MRISDWSSDVCSSDLVDDQRVRIGAAEAAVSDHFHEVVAGIVAAAVVLEVDALLLTGPLTRRAHEHETEDRKSDESGKRVSVSVEIGRRRNVKNNITT